MKTEADCGEQIEVSRLSSRALALFSLGSVCLMWSIPFLDWRDREPLGFFYDEWDTFFISLGALTFLLLPQSWKQQTLPRIALLPAGMVVVALLHLLMNKLSYPCQALTYSLYLIWALLLMQLGRQLRESLGLATVVTALCASVLVGAEISAVIANIQYYHWHSMLDPFIIRSDSQSAIGNIGQLNHLAAYLTMGLVSLALLQARASLRLWQALLLALPMLLVLTLTASRSTWLYLIAFFLLSCFWRKRSSELMALFRFSLLLLPLFALMHGVVHLPWFEVSHVSAMTPLEKMGDMTGYKVRLYLWYEAWHVFLEHPLLGAGLGQFGWQHFLLGPELHNPVPGQISNNAHNLLFQMAAETGMAGLLIIGVSGWFWLRGQRRQPINLYSALMYILLTIMAIHSLLEFPLWYAYFLAIAALLLGMLDTKHIRFNLSRNAPLLMVGVLLLSGLILFRVQGAYADLAGLYAPISNGINPDAVDEGINAALNRLEKENILRHYGHVYATSMMKFGIDKAEWRLALSQRAAHVAPTRALVYRLAVLQAVNGQPDKAKATMKQAIWAYPDHYDAVVRHALPWLVIRAPQQLRPLNDFARQAYQDRQRFVAGQ